MRINIRYEGDQEEPNREEGSPMQDPNHITDEEIIYAPLDAEERAKRPQPERQEPSQPQQAQQTQAQSQRCQCSQQAQQAQAQRPQQPQMQPQADPMRPQPTPAQQVPQPQQVQSQQAQPQQQAEQTSPAQREGAPREVEDDFDDSVDPVCVDVEDGYVGDAEASGEEDVEMVPKEDYDFIQMRYDRLMADWENYRRRSAEEIASAKDLANRNLIEALIPTIDNFALALDHVRNQGNDNPQVAGVVSGFEAIQRSLLSQLSREGLEVIDPEIGSEFDMLAHQAIERRECDLPTDSVAAVIQPGYKFKGTVIRPAMIAVSA